MSGAYRRHVTAFAFMVMMLLPLFTAIEGQDHLHGAPDLVITRFEAVPTQDGYQGVLVIKNIGPSSTDNVDAIVFDEVGGMEGNRTIVVQFPVPDINPDEDYEKTFKWEPEILGTHILWAVVDVDGLEKERSKVNNVGSLMMSLPTLNSASSESDGDPEPDVFGDYISGIENWVDLEIEYDGLEIPSLIRVYATVDGQFLEYGTHSHDSTFTTSFDAGSLPPGKHQLLINSTYGGQYIGSRFFTINVVPRPPWYSDLEGEQSYFDADLRAYALKGRLEIPEYTFSPVVKGIGEIEPITVFEGNNEFFLSANILLDGTTTLNGDCDLVISYGEVQKTIHQSGITFSKNMIGPIELITYGSAEVELDLVDIALGRQMTVDTPLQDRITVPIPSLQMTGNISSSAELHIDQDGKITQVIGDASWLFSGNTTDIFNLQLPGYDDPLVGLTVEAQWPLKVDDRSGHWEVDGELDLGTEVYICDLGLEWGEPPENWDVSSQGLGLDIAVDGDGNLGTLELSVKDGHMTQLIYRDDQVESEVYVNNTYKSSPDLEYLWDGRPMVVWTETGYMENRSDRAASMRMRYLIGDIGGNFSGPPLPLFSDGYIDQHPVLASDHENERTALIWIRDMDGNVTSMTDREVMIAFYEPTGWTTPARLTDDNIYNSRPDVILAPGGNVHTLWHSGDDVVYWDMDISPGPSRTVRMGANVSFHEAGFIRINEEDPPVQLVISEPGAGYELIHMGTSNTTVASSTSCISSPGVILGPFRSYITFWTQHDNKGGDLYSIVTTAKIDNNSWSKPLRLTSDQDLYLSPVLAWNGDDTFTIGSIVLPYLQGNATPAPVDIFREVDLSWGGEIISLEATPGPGATPGSMVKVTASVEYRGMTPVGMVRVDLYRVIRDKDSGEISQEFWGSEMVDFTIYGQIDQVEFTVPVKEFQLGMIAYSMPHLSNFPAHNSQRFVSLSALPDLEILSLELVETEPMEARAKAGITVKNWGVLSSGTRDLRVLASRPSAPQLFENGSFEPLFLRERKVWMELNSSEIEIPAGATSSFEMSFNLSPGLNHIWVSLVGPNWLPVPESHGELVLISLPLLDMEVVEDVLVLDQSDRIDISVHVKNLGPWPLNTDFNDPPDDHGYDLHPELPNYSIRTSLELSWIGTLLFNSTGLSDLDPGEGRWFNWTLPPLGTAGVLSLNISISSGTGYPIDGWMDPRSHRGLIVSSEPDLVLLSLVQEKKGEAFSSGMDVQFLNPTGARLDVVHLKLYNGYPEDNVVISEFLILDLGPGESGAVTLNMPLEEGRYILTVTAEAAVVTEDGTEMEWFEMDRYVRDISIEGTGPPEEPDLDEVDMDEVTTAGIITVSAMMVVLMVASFFYRRENQDQD